MKKVSKEYYKFCEKYKENTNIKIEFLYDNSTEGISSDDYAKNHILKCGCANRNHCTRERKECPVWQEIKW